MGQVQEGAAYPRLNQIIIMDQIPPGYVVSPYLVDLYTNSDGLSDPNNR